MKKTLAVIASTGRKSGFPPAPHLLEKLLGEEFDVTVVTNQTEPEPSKFSFYFQLLKVSLFKSPHVIHTFGTLGSFLILLKRIWDSGSHWVHTVPSTDSKFENWLHRNIFSRFCDKVFTFSQHNEDFQAHLNSADSEIDRLQSLYRDCCRIGVVMIAPLATHVTGGLQKQIRLQSHDLDPTKFQVFLLQRQDHALKTGNSTWQHVTLWQTWDPFKSISSRGASKKFVREALFLTLGFLKLFRNRKRFHLMHAYQLFTPTTLGVIARTLLNKPLVVKVSASGYSGEKRTLATLPLFGLRLKSFAKIDRVIVLSHEMSAEMRELGFEENRLSLIPNGVEIAEEVWDVAHTQNVFQILYCGKLTNDKCVEHILEAAQILGKRGYKLEINLVGGPNYQQDTGPKLKAMAYSIRKNVQVNFYGEQRDMGAFYRKADCFILPSKSEGLSNALLEAQSYGTPCIVSDILPNRFVVTDEVNGLLFRQGSQNDLAKKIEILIADKFQNDSQLGQKFSLEARRNIRNRFSNQHVIQKIQEVYHELLKY